MKKFTTYSDAGSLKIGNENFQILIPNGYGDGKTYVHLCEKGELPDNIKEQPWLFFTSFSGNDINIYDYDGDGAHVVMSISGRFGVYSDHRHVYIERWEV